MKKIINILLLIFFACVFFSCSSEGFAGFLDVMTSNILGTVKDDASELSNIVTSADSTEISVTDGYIMLFGIKVNIAGMNLDNSTSYFYISPLSDEEQKTISHLLSNISKAEYGKLIDTLSKVVDQDVADIARSTALLLSYLLSDYKIVNSETGLEQNYSDFNKAISSLSGVLADIAENDTDFTVGDVLYLQTLITVVESIITSYAEESGSANLESLGSNKVFNDRILSSFSLFILLSYKVDQADGTGSAINADLVNGALEISDALIRGMLI